MRYVALLPRGVRELCQTTYSALRRKGWAYLALRGKGLLSLVDGSLNLTVRVASGRGWQGVCSPSSLMDRRYV